MNSFATHPGRSLRTFFAALLLPVSAAFAASDRSAAPHEDPHTLLDTALSYEMAPGAYRKDTVETDEFWGMRMTQDIREYLLIKSDGSRLVRTEIESSGPKPGHVILNTYLVNEEGSWSLRADRTAIRFPKAGIEDAAAESKQTFKDRIAGLPLTLRRETEGAHDYLVISADLSEADMAGGRAVASKVMGEFEGSIPSGGPRKTFRKRVMSNIPARIEYWLKEPSRLLSSLRFYKKTGARLSVMNFDYDAYVPIPEPPAGFFAVPEGYEKVQPKSTFAFAKSGAEHPAEVRRVEPPESQ